MSERTPAPWTAYREDSEFPPGHQWVVCSEDRIVVERIGPALNESSWEADARLIAAAPDLLSALEEIDGATGWAGLGDTVAVHIHNLARAAIAKAIGQ